MKYFRTLFCVLLLSPGLLFAQEPADLSEQNQQAAENLSAILQEMQTLDAAVEQLTLDQEGREIQVFQARLILEKPRHFYWEILSPYSELLVTDGTRIWLSEPDLEQVTIELFDNDMSRTPLLLLNGDARELAGSYFISSADQDLGSRQRFILTPRAPDSLFERLSLTFADRDLLEMQFEDSLGQKTSLTFSELEINAEIDPATFVFRMPEGVEVIDNTGG